MDKCPICLFIADSREYNNAFYGTKKVTNTF